jgi:hypothetical protein
VSKVEILDALPRLSHHDRRELITVLLELEEDANTLAECDRLALERFQRLDTLESDDARAGAR